jgi:hypothetical protein
MKAPQTRFNEVDAGSSVSNRVACLPAKSEPTIYAERVACSHPPSLQTIYELLNLNYLF